MPGRLIVALKTARIPLPWLQKQFLKSLGTTLALAAAAIDTIIKPITTYCASFPEPNLSLHFHVLRCTEWLTKLYKKSCPAKKAINGANLLNWIDKESRKGKHSTDMNKEVKRIIPKFRQYFRGKEDEGVYDGACSP